MSKTLWIGSWRDEAWAKIEGPWDILIIGGGITGAGIFREACRLGLKALLVEQKDFAFGTSSRSSKMVHGGLRYLKEGRLSLTRASVHEREQLLDEGPGLIEPIGFLLSLHKGDFPARITFGVGLTVYDLLALQWDHEYYSPEDFRMLAPRVALHGLKGGFHYGDAQTDDARLVLRVIREAVADGGMALNYTSAEELLWDETEGDRRVVGARLRDSQSGFVKDVTARVVVNATGAWADRLRGAAGAHPRIRPLRGSHLVFPGWRLPVAQAVTFFHPFDGRPVYVFPWEGVTLVGTTDIDHESPMDQEPMISPQEVAYLMAAAESQFPSLGLSLEDILSTFSGIRPVIGSGKANPSQEARDHVVWEENGLLTVTGGKMTTFRLIALDTLKALRVRFPGLQGLDSHLPVLNQVDPNLPGGESLDEKTRRRLIGRYGTDAPALVGAAQPGELLPIPGTRFLWAELRWAARAEGVIHLDDLLLRRVRLGLILPQGGAPIMPAIRAICQPELGWDDARWEAEQTAFLELWRRCYCLPDRAQIPDWKALLEENRLHRQRQASTNRQKWFKRSTAAVFLAGLAGGLAVLFWKRERQATD